MLAVLGRRVRRGEPWLGLFGKPPRSLRITVNKQFAEVDTPIKGGDEIAFVAFNMA